MPIKKNTETSKCPFCNIFHFAIFSNLLLLRLSTQFLVLGPVLSPSSTNSTIVSFSVLYLILGIKPLPPLCTLAQVLFALKICAKCALRWASGSIQTLGHILFSPLVLHFAPNCATHRSLSTDLLGSRLLTKPLCTSSQLKWRRGHVWWFTWRRGERAWELIMFDTCNLWSAKRGSSVLRYPGEMAGHRCLCNPCLLSWKPRNIDSRATSVSDHCSIAAGGGLFADGEEAHWIRHSLSSAETCGILPRNPGGLQPWPRSRSQKTHWGCSSGLKILIPDPLHPVSSSFLQDYT